MTVDKTKCDGHRLAKRRLAFSRIACAIMSLLLTVLLYIPARASDLYSEGDFDIRWDNTLRYSAGFRVESRSADLVRDPNADDGDRNFSAGLVSDRFDLVSEFDISRGGFGFHGSATAWYDTSYFSHTANDSPETFNPSSVPNYKFTRAVRNLHGEDANIEDAFLYGNVSLEDVPISFRIGRHTLLWGESLFFANNGIAAGQAPLDEIKELSEPEVETKEVLLPVAQISATVQPSTETSLSFYYQLEWRKTRLPGSGSYFSDADYLDNGGERLIVGPGKFLIRERDLAATASGQFGLALRVRADDVDYGLYFERFNAKEPELELLPAFAASSLAAPQQGQISAANPAVENAGNYRLVYPTGIELYGASFSGYLYEWNLAGEISARRNMPLVSLRPSFPPKFVGEPSYATGDTLHAQLSSTMTFGPTPTWNSADLSMEIASNYRLSTTSNAPALDPSRDKLSVAFRAVFEPKYFQVAPNLDVSVPIGLGYGLIGRSSTDDTQNAGAGDIELGVSATYRAVWKGNFTFTHFVGSPAKQPFADRDFLELSVERTF